jgi:hypothetical protein
MTDALCGWLPKAMEVPQCEFEGEQPLPAAGHVLKACWLSDMLPPRGPTKVEDAVLAEQQCQGKRRRAVLLTAL